MRKGVMYSLVMFMLLVLVLGLTSTGSFFIISDDEFMTRKLLTDQLNRFESNVRGDIDKAIDVSARRAMVSAINDVLTTGNPLDNSTLRIRELMQNGTLYGEEQGLMIDNTLEYWFQRMVLQGEQSGFEVNISYTGFDIELIDSFVVQFNVTVILNTTDVFHIMNLSETLHRSVNVSVERFEDPTFPIETYGRVKRVIYKAPFTNFSIEVASGTAASGNTKNTTIIADSSDTVYINSIPDKDSKILVTDDASNVDSATLAQFSGVISETTDLPSASIPYIIGVTDARNTVPNDTLVYMDQATTKAWDLNNLEQMVNLSYYVSSENGASFFDRLEGRLSNTYNHGIESFADFQELTDFDLIVNPSKTSTDHLYFSTSSHPGYQVRGFYYEWFRIDNESDDGILRPEKYGVEELIE